MEEQRRKVEAKNAEATTLFVADRLTSSKLSYQDAYSEIKTPINSDALSKKLVAVREEAVKSLQGELKGYEAVESYASSLDTLKVP